MRRIHILVIFIALKLISGFLLVLPEYELHRDEFLHIDQGRHLAWGYISVPPLTSWSSWFILQFGAPEFLVRLVPAIWGALTLLMVYKTVRLFAGGTFALLLALTSTTFSALMRLNLLYQPNSADVFFWSLLLYLLLALHKTGHAKYLYFAAMAFAFGMLNKYNIAFLAVGLGAGIVIAGNRKIFFDRHFYLSALLALLILSPHIYWQFDQGFPVVRHMAELRETQLDNVNRADFLFEQLLFFAGSLWVIVAGVWALLFLQKNKQYRFAGIAFLVTLTIFVLARAKGYYAIGLYPIMLAVGAVWWERFTNIWVRSILIAVPIILFAALLEVAFPLRAPQYIANHPESYQNFGLLRWEDGQDHTLPQDFADMLGWKELAARVSKAHQGLKGKTLVLCDNYGQAGAINFYAPGIAAVSFNADYVNWFPSGKIDHLIRVREEKNSASNQDFGTGQQVTKAGVVINPHAREKGTSIFVIKNVNMDVETIMNEGR